MDRLSEIRARCEELEQSGEGFTVVRPVYIQGALLDDGYSEKWSAVAAHAREDIPFLLAEVERLTARAEKAEAERDAAYEKGFENGQNNMLEAGYVPKGE